MEWNYGDITSRILAASMEVHHESGRGFPEHVYGRALVPEFPIHSLNAITAYAMSIFYKAAKNSIQASRLFCRTSHCYRNKAVANTYDEPLAQALNYPEACNPEIGLCINFSTVSLQYKSLINRKYKH